MKISVIVVAFNMPDFIQPQFDLLNKYLLNDFDLFVYNNSNNELVSNRIKEVCDNIGINCISIPQYIFERNDPSYRAGKSLDYAINHNITTYNDYSHMMLLDSDMFLVSDFDINEYLDNYDLMGIHQERGHVFYYTNQLVFANLSNLINFEKEVKFLPGVIDGQSTDCGGYLFNYINKYNIKHKGITDNKHSGEINHLNIENVDNNFIEYFKNEINILDGNSFAEYFGGKFLHFRAGSNWIGFSSDITTKRNSILFKFLKNKQNKKGKNEKNY